MGRSRKTRPFRLAYRGSIRQIHEIAPSNRPQPTHPDRQPKRRVGGEKKFFPDCARSPFFALARQFCAKRHRLSGWKTLPNAPSGPGLNRLELGTTHQRAPLCPLSASGGSAV